MPLATWRPPLATSAASPSSQVMMSTPLANAGLLIRGSILVLSQLSAAASLSESGQAGGAPGEMGGAVLGLGGTKGKDGRTGGPTAATGWGEETDVVGGA